MEAPEPVCSGALDGVLLVSSAMTFFLSVCWASVDSRHAVVSLNARGSSHSGMRAEVNLGRLDRLRHGPKAAPRNSAARRI